MNLSRFIYLFQGCYACAKVVKIERNAKENNFFLSFLRCILPKSGSSEEHNFSEKQNFLSFYSAFHHFRFSSFHHFIISAFHHFRFSSFHHFIISAFAIPKYLCSKNI